MREKKALIIPLLALLVFSSCTKKGDGSSTLGEDILWSISASQKVVRNRDKGYYSRFITAPNLDIRTCQGEAEMSHLVISPNVDVASYEVSVSKLVHPQGYFIPQDHVSVLAARYCNVSTIYDTATGEEPGWFPDALIPIEAIVEHHQNKIKAGENQSLYLKVDCPLVQKPGVYSGTVRVRVDDLVKDLPVSVEVYDYQVSEKTHSKALFEPEWQFESGELDSTENMFENYTEALYDYRLSGNQAMNYNSHSDEDIHEFTNRSYELMQDPRCTLVCIPVELQYVDVPNVTASFNEAIFKKYLRSFFLKSVTTGFDMLEKSVFYMGGLIDEPDDLGIEDRAVYVCERYRIALQEVADELDLAYREYPMHDRIIESLRNVPNIVTASWSEKFDGVIDTYCPKANFYDTAEQRAHYDEQKEKWWYTCVKPRAPYPTYHTEDGLPSARLNSWMMANYDIVGNLFWAVNVYARVKNDIYFPIDDYYEGDACRYPGVNGDGYLFYPGKPYGYDRPMGSLRLEAIRDGLEEYELFYDLKNTLSDLEIDQQATFDFLTKTLYEGTKIHAQCSDMDNARDDLVKLILANKNGSDFSIVESSIDEPEHRADYVFYAKEGSTIKVNGSPVEAGESYKEGNLYRVSVPLVDGEDNILKLEVIHDGKSVTIEHNLGRKAAVYQPQDLKNAFSNYNSSVMASVVSDPTYGEVLRLDVGRPRSGKQSIKFIPSFLKDINDGTAKLVFDVINPYEENLYFSVGYSSTYNTYDSFFSENVSLKPGLNRVEVNLAITKWSKVGQLRYLMLVLGNTADFDQDAKTIYLKDVFLTSKQGAK